MNCDLSQLEKRDDIFNKEFLSDEGSVVKYADKISLYSKSISKLECDI